jgi:hypothetical protein
MISIRICSNESQLLENFRERQKLYRSVMISIINYQSPRLSTDFSTSQDICESEKSIPANHANLREYFEKIRGFINL